MSRNNGKNPRRRVVVTGIGAVSPNGVGSEAFWRATRAGVSGIDRISSFDPSALACRVAGEVKNFHAEHYLSAQDLKRTGRAVPLAVAAAQEALQSAGLEAPMTLEEKRSWGVILGSGGGTPDFTEEQYRLYFSDQLRKASAYQVSRSTIGTLSSEISLPFGCRGQSPLRPTRCTSSTDAIGYAFNLIRFGQADRLVTGGVDSTTTPGVMPGVFILRVLSTP